MARQLNIVGVHVKHGGDDPAARVVAGIESFRAQAASAGTAPECDVLVLVVPASLGLRIFGELRRFVASIRQELGQ